MRRLVCDRLVAVGQLLQGAVTTGTIQVSVQLHLWQRPAQLPSCRHATAVMQCQREVDGW